MVFHLGEALLRFVWGWHVSVLGVVMGYAGMGSIPWAMMGRCSQFNSKSDRSLIFQNDRKRRV